MRSFAAGSFGCGSAALNTPRFEAFHFKLACFAALILFGAETIIADSSSSPTNAQPTVILVVGASGEEEYGQQFAQSAKRWEAVCHEGDAKLILLGLDQENATTDHDRLKQALADEPKESLGELWLVLMGHGTFDGKEAKFNLRGPDLSEAECGEWLQSFQRPVVLINCASSSGPFLNPLSKQGRVVITATRSGYEQNYARFGEFLSGAISDPAADLDKDGQTSLLEAFLIASSRVAEFYKSEGRLATEHSLLDDNGDGRGTPADWFHGIRATKKAAEGASVDGLRAHQIHLVRSTQERELPTDLRTRRDKLELDIVKLREIKEKIPEDEYYGQLEPLLIELARLYDKNGNKGPPK